MKSHQKAKKESYHAEPYTSSFPGMQWNADNDILEVCCGADKEVTKKFTYRAVFSSVASVFDPFGLFAPFRMKMLILPKTYGAKIRQQWMKNNDDQNEEQFLDWVSELVELRDMPLRRL